MGQSLTASCLNGIFSKKVTFYIIMTDKMTF